VLGHPFWSKALLTKWTRGDALVTVPSDKGLFGSKVPKPSQVLSSARAQGAVTAVLRATTKPSNPVLKVSIEEYSFSEAVHWFWQPFHLAIAG
jgi:hypothetical protein